MVARLHPNATEIGIGFGPNAEKPELATEKEKGKEIKDKGKKKRERNHPIN